MIYALYGFILGCLIPYIARRFAKFMPATLAYALYRIVKPNKKVSKAKRRASPRYGRLMHQYFMRSLGWGVVTAALSYLAYVEAGYSAAPWYLAYIWILLLLTEIDNRMFLLPDILTYPLLLIGLSFALFNGYGVNPAESIIGAVGGFVLPVAASLLFVWKNKDAFGGGDIKLLTALGAWLGLERLLYVIVLSSILFLAWALIRRRRVGAYGPAIAIAAIMVAFYYF